MQGAWPTEAGNSETERGSWALQSSAGRERSSHTGLSQLSGSGTDLFDICFENFQQHIRASPYMSVLCNFGVILG